MEDQDKIPAPPWTFAALEETKEGLYWRLGAKYGCVDPTDRKHTPDLDLSHPYAEQEAARTKKKAPDAVTQT